MMFIRRDGSLFSVDSESVGHTIIDGPVVRVIDVGRSSDQMMTIITGALDSYMAQRRVRFVPAWRRKRVIRTVVRLAQRNEVMVNPFRF